MKVIIMMFASILLAATNIPQASAHVLLNDISGKQGAILHITPDDDPVAGEPSMLYFEASGIDLTKARVALSITDNVGNRRDLILKVNESLAVVSYTFPSMGVYHLSYRIKTNEGQYDFAHSQLVSRGVAGDFLQSSVRHAWAEPVLIGGLLLLGTLGIMAFNRRRQIARRSTF